MRRVQDDPNYLFTLRVQVFRGDRLIVIHAFDGNQGANYSPTHNRIDVEVRQGGEVIFPRGATWCGIPNGHMIDGVYAREAVLSLVAMKPGDTDSEYFESYTDRQSAWAGRYGEHLSCEAQYRYCDENGAVRE